jgi:hypothetical protein
MDKTEFRVTLDTSAVRGVIRLARATLEAAKAAGVEGAVTKELTAALSEVVESVTVEPVES